MLKLSRKRCVRLSRVQHHHALQFEPSGLEGERGRIRHAPAVQGREATCHPHGVARGRFQGARRHDLQPRGAVPGALHRYGRLQGNQPRRRRFPHPGRRHHVRAEIQQHTQPVLSRHGLQLELLETESGPVTLLSNTQFSQRRGLKPHQHDEHQGQRPVHPEEQTIHGKPLFHRRQKRTGQETPEPEHLQTRRNPPEGPGGTGPVVARVGSLVVRTPLPEKKTAATTLTATLTATLSAADEGGSLLLRPLAFARKKTVRLRCMARSVRLPPAAAAHSLQGLPRPAPLLAPLARAGCVQTGSPKINHKYGNFPRRAPCSGQNHDGKTTKAKQWPQKGSTQGVRGHSWEWRSQPRVAV